MRAPAAAVGCKPLLGNGQLDASAKVHRCRVFDMQHAPWLTVDRLRRRMDGQGAHRHDPARASDAVDWRRAASHSRDRRIAQNAAHMRIGQHPEWPVRPRRVVEADPKRHQLFRVPKQVHARRGSPLYSPTVPTWCRRNAREVATPCLDATRPASSRSTFYRTARREMAQRRVPRTPWRSLTSVDRPRAPGQRARRARVERQLWLLELDGRQALEHAPHLCSREDVLDDGIPVVGLDHIWWVLPVT